ncbi:MAG: 30S ribosomal protein S18, partial [Alcaligenes sp.]|nr:30S ribosomal protein S18 [Alcaligenes sp.]
MAFRRGKDKKRKFAQQNPLFKRRKFCRFTVAGVE